MVKFLKVNIEAQLGLIGGTMGLLTGFSILSGVEIVYYLFRFLWILFIRKEILPHLWTDAHRKNMDVLVR